MPWPIFASFSNLVAASQNGKLYSSKYFSRSRATLICGLGDGVDGGVNTPFRFVIPAVLKAVRQTYRSQNNRCEDHNGQRTKRAILHYPSETKQQHRQKYKILSNWISFQKCIVTDVTTPDGYEIKLYSVTSYIERWAKNNVVKYVVFPLWNRICILQ